MQCRKVLFSWWLKAKYHMYVSAFKEGRDHSVVGCHLLLLLLFLLELVCELGNHHGPPAAVPILIQNHLRFVNISFERRDGLSFRKRSCIVLIAQKCWASIDSPCWGTVHGDGAAWTCIDFLVAELDDGVQILQSLLLGVLSLAQLLDQVLLHALQLLHLISYFVDLILTPVLSLSILFWNGFGLLLLCECFVLQKLLLMLFDLHCSLPFCGDVFGFGLNALMIAFFFPFNNEMLRFLIHGENIVVIAAFFLTCQVLQCLVMISFPFFLHLPLLSESYFFFDLSLMAIPSIEKFPSFLSSDVS